MVIFALLAATLLSANAQVDPGVHASLRADVRAEYEILSSLVDDLNQDGLPDWVGVLKIQRSHGPHTRIYVLQREKSGMAVKGRSKEIAFMDCAGTCGVEMHDAKRGDFFVRQYDAGGWGRVGVITQFSLRNHRWIAIGQRRTSIDADHDVEETVDVNLLTGQFVTSKISGGMSGHASPPRTTRGVRRSAKPIGLERFDPVYF
ncbi:MAG: hypothetical protein JNK17_05645 [Hydrogenophaga sp.]|nr:hypothetical protein [Hydrogenophaga sp.]